MDGTSGGTAAGTDTDKKAVRAAAVRSIISNLLSLIIPVGILVYWFGGNTVRAWMLGFLWGLFGLAGQPDPSLVAGPSSEANPPAESTSKPPLKLLGHGCHRESQFQVCEGEVRNETDHQLEDVMAEVRFKDAYGVFVKSESSLIDYQPLMPGQSSPFKVMCSDNPQIRHYSINFRQMFEGELKAAR